MTTRTEEEAIERERLAGIVHEALIVATQMVERAMDVYVDSHYDLAGYVLGSDIHGIRDCALDQFEALAAATRWQRRVEVFKQAEDELEGREGGPE